MFPGEPNLNLVAYGQSRGAVEYLITEFGRESISELMATIDSGVPFNEAMQRVYGFDTRGMDERWRARVVMQLALARIENAPLVVIDRADILDQEGRNGLFALPHKLKIPALVAMTMKKPQRFPDLPRLVGWRSYRCEAGPWTAVGTD